MEIQSYISPTGLHARFIGTSSFEDYKEVEQLCLKIEHHAGAIKEVVIDISGVEFMDSSGLGLLLLLKEHCDRCRVSIQLQHPQGQVRRIFEASRLNELFGLPYQ